jgi:adenine/guanine/hypoxanthine permease
MNAAAFALAAAVLTFFGFMHGESIGLGVTPTVAVAYAIVAAFIYGLARYPLGMIEMAPPPREALAHPAE